MPAVRINGIKANCIAAVANPDSIKFDLKQFISHRSSGNGIIPMLNTESGRVDYTKDFEVKIKFKVTNDPSDNILLTGSDYYEYSNPSVAIYESRTKIWLGFSTNNETWNQEGYLNLDNALSSNVWYSVLYGYKVINSQYIVYIRLLDADNIIIAQNNSLLSMNSPQVASGGSELHGDWIKFGGNKNEHWVDNNELYFDFGDSYIKNDNKILWGKRNVSSPSPAPIPVPSISSLEIQNPVSEQYIEFWNDDRFEITYNVYGAWSVQNLFTYDGHNMYSSPQIQDNQKSQVYIKNITDKSILIKIVYDSDTERSDFDYGEIYIDNILIITNIGGSASGETKIFNIPSGSTLTISYRKDGSTSKGADNIGILIYETKE